MAFFAKKHVDPVCGMKVDDGKHAAAVTRDGQVYYFCSSSCASKFNANPRQYS